MRLADDEVRAALSPSAALAAVRAACVELAAGSFESPPRVVLDDGHLLVMPVRHRPSGTGTVKVVTVGANGVQGTVTWVGPDGSTTPLGSAVALTELRTAAVTAAALDAQACADAHRLVVLGTGRQARAHVRAFAELRPLTDVALVGRDPARAEACCAELARELPAIRFHVPDDVQAELRRADLVLTATTSSTPVLRADDLAADVHVFAVGTHRPTARELPRELLATASEVVVDDVAACLAESGEVVDAVRAEVVRAPDLVPLHRRLGTGPGTGRTVFKSVGVAAFDWALASVLAAAVAAG